MSGKTILEIKFDKEKMLYDITSFVGERGFLRLDKTKGGFCVLVTNGFDEEFKEFWWDDYITVE